jgi:hypothetical protein
MSFDNPIKMEKEEKGLDNYKYYKIDYNNKQNESNSELALKLYSITQFYPAWVSIFLTNLVKVTNILGLHYTY